MLRDLTHRSSEAATGLARIALGGVAMVFLSAPGSLDPAAINPVDRNADMAGSNALAQELLSFTVQSPALLDQDSLSAQTRNASIPFAARLSDRMAPFRSISSQSDSYSTALNCMTEAIYYEAANESTAGQRAVAQVILNRVAHPAYPSSVCGVIYQGWQDSVCQFSYTCDGSLARRPLPHLWNRSREVARAALDGYVEESVGTATHYHADYVVPYWGYRLDKVHVEGRHIFYRLPGRTGRSASFTARWNGREFKPVFDPARFAHVDAPSVDIEAGARGSSNLARDITDRRAENDVGGRLDTSKGWTLSIPDPTTASSGYQAALEGQEGQPLAPQAGGIAQP